MNTHNEAFQNSLRCLQHPLSLVGIVVLLLNDHVLKIVNPSWLTGKLSDFAGLFFFPFIMAAGLSFLLANFNFTSYSIGRLAFGIVAIWFFLLKTFTFINSITSKFISHFISGPAQIILDPTDILAILAMIPAWMLWRDAKEIKSSKLAYMALCIGAFAATATSPREQTIYKVTDLNYSEDGIVYAADRDENYGEWFPVAISRDHGLTWEQAFNKESMQHIDKKTYPVEYCKYLEYYQVTHCYRVTSNQKFEYGFNYPRFDKQGDYAWSPVFRPGGIIVRAYDMIVIPCEDHECMLVAIGEAGILRRVLPNGNWEIVDVLGAHSHEVFSNNP